MVLSLILPKVQILIYPENPIADEISVIPIPIQV